MSTASQLRDALLSLATPKPKELPPALAGVFPAGCFLRARTAAEDLEMVSLLDGLTATQGSDYAKGQTTLFLALSYSLCNSAGELVAKGDWGIFSGLPVNSLEAIQKELASLAKNEVAEQGKDLQLADSPAP